MLLFYLLYYAAVLLKFTNCIQYHAQLQEQELWSDYYAIHTQICMDNRLNIADFKRLFQ